MAGPASAMAISILMDAVPAERRGRAMGTVMGAFSAASVLGVPAGLELAHWAGWRAPFLVIGGVILLLALVTAWRVPSMRGHLEGDDAELPDRSRLAALLGDYRAWLAYATIGVSVVSGFLLIPNLSTYYQLNMGYPREDIGLLFLVGGSISFFTMRLAGRTADRLGPLAVTVTASLGYLAVLYWGFYLALPWLPVMLLFCAFMIARTTMAVSANTVVSWVPRPRERAAFMSVKNAFQHFSAAGGAFLSSHILSQDETGALLHVPELTLLAMVLALGQPVFMALLLRRLHVRL
ncbi:MFS transporter, partial [Ectothiorhodospiraceae bacterium WFHF3C12]|nr:MFS transporter [Ectothiorhodospiraceae bacterium WFHF3C12]